MPDGFSFTFDDREFGEAVEFVERATGRMAKDTINRAALHVIIGGKGFQGAMQLTPKASRSAIKGIPVEKVGGFVARKFKGTRISKDQFAMEVKKEIARRIRAIGYTAFAGYQNAAKAFGGTGLKGVTAGNKKLSRFGKGTKATGNIDPEATLTNTAPMAEQIGEQALQKAITNVARDLVEYGTRKLDEIYKKVSV